MYDSQTKKDSHVGYLRKEKPEECLRVDFSQGS